MGRQLQMIRELTKALNCFVVPTKKNSKLRKMMTLSEKIIEIGKQTKTWILDSRWWKSDGRARHR